MERWRVGGFTEVRELGVGAQGRVVLARHDESGGLVAIKYLAHADDDPETLERLRGEAVMLAKVSDPHVVRLYRFVTGAQGAAMVMEAVDGVSLRKILDTHGALAPEAALLVLKGSLQGLAAAHAVGVVHRDYKPANVVVRSDGTSKLIDFGVAALFGSGGHAGSPAYMAPEQWEGDPASPATDVYGATCVFFECVTGRRPYADRDPVALMRRHLLDAVPAEAVDEPLRHLVLRGMAKSPADRPLGATAFAAELEAVATAAYGEDWEGRGVRALAAGAAALAALFPLAGLSMAGSAGAAGAVGATGASSGGGLLAAVGGKAAVAVAGSALAVTTVAGAATYAVQRANSDPAPAPVRTTAQVTLVTTQHCQWYSRPGAVPAGRRVPLPAQVTMPPGAAVYELRDPYFTRFIAPAGQKCTADGGSGVGSAWVGPSNAVRSVQLLLYSRGYACAFPGTPQARDERDRCRTTPADGAPEKENVRTGAQGYLAHLTAKENTGTEGRRRSVTLSMLTPETSSPDQRPFGPEISCFAPKAEAALCVAALTYHYVERMARSGVRKAALDRAAKQIADYVAVNL
ncbi:serine/threonine-protein kinase [Thermomonospora umbrina]|uniref:non-specific serine/threonine protein kinase n=1 Tax=Thermomonospora umbrina TaxID=111806 RepID=A0A3D9SYE9_9ACTN|nr:serine/threonine-protein kinase [Thermomonospora umbrina]REE98015.1 serine/threonine protein kinase [Thermomonospora umbrina]